MDFVKKGKKVTVIGAGNVGASIAFTLAIKGLCSELLLVDINKPKAKGEAMDIMQGTAFCPAVDVHNIHCFTLCLRLIDIYQQQ